MWTAAARLAAAAARKKRGGGYVMLMNSGRVDQGQKKIDYKKEGYGGITATRNMLAKALKQVRAHNKATGTKQSVTEVHKRAGTLMTLGKKAAGIATPKKSRKGK